MQSKTVTTSSGTRKLIIANNPADFVSAISVAKAETVKVLDINNASYANKRYKDL